MKDVLKQKRDAYLARFRDPDAKWEFKEMWGLPYEILCELPEEKKPPLYKKVLSSGFPFEEAVAALAARKESDLGTFQLGWMALSRRMPWDFIWTHWDAYPWDQISLSRREDLDWLRVWKHPERFYFATLSCDQPESIKVAAEHPNYPWEAVRMPQWHPRRHIDLTIERVIALRIPGTYHLCDLECISLEDILRHPEVKWDDDIYSVSHHRDLTVDILRRWPGWPWNWKMITWNISLDEMLAHRDEFPWDANALSQREAEEPLRRRRPTVEELLAIPPEWDEGFTHLADDRDTNEVVWTVEELLALWDHPELKQRFIEAYSWVEGDRGETFTLGKDLCRRKTPPSWDVIFKRANDTNLVWDWEHLSRIAPWDIIEAHQNMPWDFYELGKRNDLTWERVKSLTNNGFPWRWDALSRNDHIIQMNP